MTARAQEYLDNIKGGTGAYSESKGALICRRHVAQGITERDGFPCDVDDLWLTDGASAAVNYLMRILIRDKNDAILVPIPQYPLYSATLSLYGKLSAFVLFRYYLTFIATFLDKYRWLNGWILPK